MPRAHHQLLMGAAASAYHTDNLVYMLDAGASSSYGGSGQTWANVVAAPSDGSGQTAYDYLLGATSSAEGTDPTFHGSPGTDPSWFQVDGGDYCTLAGTAPAFLKGMHKANAKWTIELWCYVPIGGDNNTRPLWDSGTSDQGGGDMSRGVLYADLGTDFGNGRHHVRVKRDSSAATAMSVISDAPLGTAAWHMLACSVDGSGAQSSFLYKDGAYDPVGSANTWDGTFSSPGSADAANPPRLFARGDVFFRVHNGCRLAVVRVYDTNLTKAQCDINWAGGRGRFGI